MTNKKNLIGLMLILILIAVIIAGARILLPVYMSGETTTLQQAEKIANRTTTPLTCTSVNLGFEIKSAKQIGNQLEIEIKNQGTAIIDRFQITMIGNYNDTLQVRQTLDSLSTITMYVDKPFNLGEVKEIIMYPVITIGANTNPCMNKERVYELK